MKKAKCGICGVVLPLSPEQDRRAEEEALARGLPKDMHTEMVCDPCWKKHSALIIANEKRGIN